MKLIEVNSPKLIKEFLQLPVRIYKDEPNWIRPLNQDIENTFKPEKNKAYKKNAKCIRWILQDSTGLTIGRVAAFINPKTVNKGNDQPTGGIGFFECINDQNAANMLFDSCKNWLADNGMEAMDGPINFGDREAWWGLLVDGFHIEPNYRMDYHMPYYQRLFENYGFQVYFKQYTYGRKIMGPVEDKVLRKNEMIKEDGNYHFENISKKHLDKYASDFCEIYNKAWAGHGVPAIKLIQAKAIMKQFKPVMDEKLVLFAYYKNEPAAFFINLPELNQIFKHLNGKFGWWSKLRFLWLKRTGACRKCFGLVFGVVPEHQKKGLDGAMVMRFKHIVQVEHPKYDDFEMNWIGDFNPKMMNVASQVGGDIVKTHHTYRYLFDQTKEFKRMRILR